MILHLLRQKAANRQTTTSLPSDRQTDRPSSAMTSPAFTAFCSCLVLVLCSILQHGNGSAAPQFSYDGNLGPHHWAEDFGQCAGKFQSPINIDEQTVERVSLPPLILVGFHDNPISTIVTNNGHTLMLQQNTTITRPLVAGGPLNGVYAFQQLHFHWGEDDTIGSEDLINNHSFPLEMHMVFYKDIYGTPEEAMNHQDGLAVLAFFFEVGEDDNEAFVELTKLYPIVSTPGSRAILDRPLLLSRLAPASVTSAEYFTYNGSLTTPPCSEVVTWLDFAKPVSLSHPQVEAFRKLRNEEGFLTHNFRPIQPLGERLVLFNTPNNASFSSATPLIALITSFLVLIVKRLN